MTTSSVTALFSSAARRALLTLMWAPKKSTYASSLISHHAAGCPSRMFYRPHHRRP